VSCGAVPCPSAAIQAKRVAVPVGGSVEPHAVLVLVLVLVFVFAGGDGAKGTKLLPAPPALGLAVGTGWSIAAGAGSGSIRGRSCCCCRGYPHGNIPIVVVVAGRLLAVAVAVVLAEGSKVIQERIFGHDVGHRGTNWKRKGLLANVAAEVLVLVDAGRGRERASGC